MCFKNLLEDRLTCSAERREGILNNKLSHLACFSGGMYQKTKKNHHMDLATRFNERLWVDRDFTPPQIYTGVTSLTSFGLILIYTGEYEITVRSTIFCILE